MANILFYSHPLNEKFAKKISEIEMEIYGQDRDYLLKVSESDLINYLKEKYQFSSIVLKTNETKTKDIRENVKGDTEFIVSIPFEGDKELFFCKASTFFVSPPEGWITHDDNKLELSIKTPPYSLNDTKIEDKVKVQFDNIKSMIEKNIGWVNKDISEFNHELPGFIQKKIQERKKQILRDEHIIAALNIPLKRTEISKTFEIPNIKQKISIKRPEVGKEKFEPSFTLNDENYTNILKIIQNMIIAMERSPTTFSKLKEEELRDFILVYLNGIFEGEALGETFNGSGKTDILIRHKGENVFIAECKFWNGQKSIQDAIDQLLGYTSWRDTKTALIIFNRNKNFSYVLKKIEETVSKHENCKKLIEKESESNLKYLFHHKADKNKELYLSVLAFDIPNK